MKTIKITLCLILAAVIFSAGVFAFINKAEESDTNNSTAGTESGSALGDVYLQHLIYAPKNSVVTLDGEKVPYSDALKCYAASVASMGKYNLKVTHDGCESVEKNIVIDMAPENKETKIDLMYTADFLSEGEKTAAELLKSLIEKCWALDSDFSEFNFYTETDEAYITSALQKIITGLEDGLSAEYTTEDISLEASSISTGDTNKICSHSKDNASLLFAFNLQYSYIWHYKSPSYADSGVALKSQQPYIVIEKIDDVWYIRDIYLVLSNSAE